MIEGYETKVEEFDSPLENELIVDNKVNRYLNESRHSHLINGHDKTIDNVSVQNKKDLN